MGKNEIPHCTVFIVVSAIICHILVLIGNLQTAQTLHSLGQSSAGWSDVGLSLGGSLGGELDHLMHATVMKLTDTLDTIIKVETDIDYVLGAVANATDLAISTMKSVRYEARASTDGRGGVGATSLSERSSQKSTAVHAHEEDDKGCPYGDCGPEAEVASFLQSSADVCEASGGCSPSDEGELASLLQGRVRTQLGGPDELVLPLPAGGKALEMLRDRLHIEVKRLVERIHDGMRKLLTQIKPALLQIGKWLKSMGPKMQGTIEELSIVIDRVQKIIDQVMAKIAGPGKHSEAMLREVFELFDVDGNGLVSADDIHKVSILYGITALQHMKGEQLLKKYDGNKDRQLTRHEFGLMLSDGSIPKASTVILRTYSRKLAEAAGKVSKSRLRDEVAHSVVQYITLVCAKSRDKVVRVSRALTDGSLPIEFVADVLKQFAHNADNPGIVDVMDVGSIAIKEMWSLDSTVVTRALEVMTDPKYWHSSGFDPAEQPQRVKQVSHWVVQAGGHSVKPQLMQLFSSRGSRDAVRTEDLAMVLSKTVETSSKRFTATQRAEKAAEVEVLIASGTSAGLFQHLLGSTAVARFGADPDVARVVQGGVMAKPQTLQFAHWLAQNATSTAKHFQNLCFDHTHTASNTVDSLATQIKGVLGKTQNFLRLMQRYSTPQGIDALESRVDTFVNHSLGEVLAFVDKKIDAEVAELRSTLSHSSLAQDQQGVSIQGLWKDVIKFTEDLKATLPTVIDHMKFAKREVSKVAATMLSTFPVVKLKGTPIFEHVKSLYATIWIVYFISFMVLSLGVLFYGFWASGYFGGPGTTADEQAIDSLTFGGRCWTCARSCGACFDRCESSDMCFWSMILLVQVVILIMFVLSMVLALTSGLRAWLSAGCGEVYLLSDNAICVGVMKGIQSWLSTFWEAEGIETPLESMCSSRSLMTCGIFSSQLGQCATFTAGGSMLATLLTAQMVLESARLHERVRWQRATESKTLEFKESSPIVD